MDVLLLLAGSVCFGQAAFYLDILAEDLIFKAYDFIKDMK